VRAYPWSLAQFLSPQVVGLTDDEEAAAEIADESGRGSYCQPGYTPDADISDDDAALSDTDENMNSMNSVVSDGDDNAPHIVTRPINRTPAKAPRSILVNSPTHGTADLPVAAGGTLSTTPTASGGTGATVTERRCSRQTRGRCTIWQ